MDENLEVRTAKEKTKVIFLSYPTEADLRPTEEQKRVLAELFELEHYSSKSGEDYFMLAHEHTKKGCDCFYHSGAD